MVEETFKNYRQVVVYHFVGLVALIRLNEQTRPFRGRCSYQSVYI